ncbi:MAG TPA: hypothetical protein VF703_00180 [Pyrinomonadaceae bacterium]|jgi:hypothetical protein
MQNEKNVESVNKTEVFTSRHQEVKEVQAGGMSLIVGTSDSLAEQLGEDEFEECTYPEIPDGVSGEYDTWLG